MKFYRPASVLQLALVAFALVGIPLAAGLVAATIAVDRLAAQGSRAVMGATQTIETGRALVDQLTAMERFARQYRLLGDPELLELYETRRAEFQASLVSLRAAPIAPGQRQKLADLEAGEATIYEALQSTSPGSPAELETLGPVEEFPELARVARAVLGDLSHVIGAELAAMRIQASRAQRLLSWQATALIPGVVVLASLGTMLIVRPLRQMDRAIRRLGDGQFDQPIQIRGPKDLEELGQRLEWLRVRLLELDEQKAQFLRHVSHELKTPLTAVREGAQLLSDEVVGGLNEAQADIARILSANSVRLQKRIEDLLNFSVIAHGSAPPPVREPVDPNDIIAEVVNDQAVALRARRIAVERVGEPVTVRADAGKLRVIVDNLLSNAIKFTPRNGRIRISVGVQDDWVKIEVADSGPGIPAAERGRVFEPFFQGHTRHEGHVKGTGLGLAIAREYVHAHGGQIEVADEPGPGGRGTVMRVQLPFAEPDRLLIAERAEAS
jgi:two-component system sensor histidine kinase GlrK